MKICCFIAVTNAEAQIIYGPANTVFLRLVTEVNPQHISSIKIASNKERRRKFSKRRNYSVLFELFCCEVNIENMGYENVGGGFN